MAIRDLHEASEQHHPLPGEPDRLAGRLGISVPHEWWPAMSLLKSFEAAGFSWVQLHSPPLSVLADPRQATAHARAAGRALAATQLSAVVHAPSDLRAGAPGGDRAFEGLLSYAAEVGAAQIVYHALAMPEGRATEATLAAEARSLKRLAARAERLGLMIAIENLAPLYPGPEPLSASPLSLRGLAQRIGSPALSLCLDLGHAHVVADGRHTGLERLCNPVLDHVSVFHVHDNLGARRRRRGVELGIDPLRLDLHLPPGRGTLPWHRVRAMLMTSRAPIVLEVHPPYRGRIADLATALPRQLAQPRVLQPQA